MDESTGDPLERWLGAGLITRAQAEEIRRFERARAPSEPDSAAAGSGGDDRPSEAPVPVRTAPGREPPRSRERRPGELAWGDTQPSSESGWVTSADAQAARAARSEEPSASDHLPPVEDSEPHPGGETELPAGRRPGPVRPRASQASKRGLLSDLASPEFVRHPPVSINARGLGLLLAALAFLALLGSAFTFLTDLFLAPGRLLWTDLENSIHLAASVVGLVGGYRMYLGVAGGGRLVQVSLGVNVLATLVFSFSRLLHFETVLALVIWVSLYYLTRMSRYPEEERS